MRAPDLVALDHDELETKLKDARRELYELRFKLAVGQLENNRQIRRVRKDIARILTVVHQRRLEITGPSETDVEVETPESVEPSEEVEVAAVDDSSEREAPAMTSTAADASEPEPAAAEAAAAEPKRRRRRPSPPEEEGDKG